MSRSSKAAGVAWLVTALYYFCQYTLRSAPAVMMPQLSEAFDLSAMGVASLAGLFYWGYSPFSLVAGVLMDRIGPRRVVPLGAAAVYTHSTEDEPADPDPREVMRRPAVHSIVSIEIDRVGSGPPGRAERHRGYFLGGLGATQYGSLDTAVGEIGGETQFSSTWALGLKMFPSPKFGLRLETRWTPTYIKTDPEGYWCDPYWGCYTVGESEFSNQFELSGGIIIRF